MHRLLKLLIAGAVLAPIALAAAIAFGGPRHLAPMASIGDPFKTVDYSDLPPVRQFAADDGALLAYRYYAPFGSASAHPLGSVVLVHGSSANGTSLHVLAKGFAQAGFATYTLDIRGHGRSGTKGRIGYIGQLEDDLSAFKRTVAPAQPSTLAGFSSGAGFVLRFAGSARQDEFQSYLLLSPFLSQRAPNFRPNSGGWVSIGIPRLVALTLIHRLGLRGLDDLPVLRFAVSGNTRADLTPAYSFALAANFGPQQDYEANIRAVHRPCAVIAGAADEVFRTDTLPGIFRAQGKNWPVTLLPGIAHIALTLDPVAVDAAVRAVTALQAGAR